jgi:short-subunit dehydrogenase
MAQTALITGASAGIGKALAEQFAADRYHVVLVARRADGLAKIKVYLESKYAVLVTVIPVDLSKPEAARQLVEHLKNEGILVDVLVNNAGFGVYGSFVHTSWQSESELLELQVRSLTCLTKYLLPAMLEKGEGGIINVASTAAYQPGPLMAVYYASKSYVLSFTEALAGELKGSGITVTALCPGPTITEFARRAELTDVMLFEAGGMSAADVARVGYAGYLRGKTTVIPGIWNRIMAYAVKLVPTKVKLTVVKQLHRKGEGKA